MVVYHGSNVEVRTPRIIRPNRTLDFGNGFYTTANRDQAVDFARRVTGNRNSGIATVNVFEVNEELAFGLCNMGVYSGPEYDLVFGPVANDDVYETLQLYVNGAISREYTMERLKVKVLFNQLVFKTDRALAFLRFVKAEVVDER